MAGDKGIYTYDNTGTNLLYSCTFDEVQINKEEDAYFTNIVQFPKEYNGLVIVLVYHILYFFNSNGKFLYKYELKLEIDSSNFQYYSMVPYIYKDNKYHFILGYINDNKKASLIYYLINPKNNETARESSFIFDNQENFDYGINCEIMNHEIYENILICFYQNNNPQAIDIKAFKLENKMIENIPNITCSLAGKTFGLKTLTSIDKKKSFLCYLNAINDAAVGYCTVYDIDKNEFVKNGKYLSKQCLNKRNVYSLEFFKETREYIFSCADSTAQINLIKFDQNFDIVSIESDGLLKNDTILRIEECYYIQYYSFIFISQGYKIIGGDQSSNKLVTVPSEYNPETIYTDSLFDFGEGEKNFDSTILSTYFQISSDKIKSTSIPIDETQSTLIIDDNIKSTLILTDKIKSTSIIIDDAQSTSIIADKIKSTLISNDDTQSASIITDKIEFSSIIIDDSPSISIIADKIKSTSITNDDTQSTLIITDKIKSTLITIDKTHSESIIIDKIKSTFIITNEIRTSLIETDKIKSSEIAKEEINSSLIEIDKIGSTLINSNINTTPSYKVSSIINYNSQSVFLECNGYKDNEGKICSENVPIGYYIYDILNKILGKCHISCESCDKGPEIGKTNCLSCNENFELNNNNNCLYKYNYYYNINSEIIYLLKDQLCPEILPYKLVELKECVENCDNEELINKLCIISVFTRNNFDLITNRIKDFVGLSNSTDYDVIIDGNNIVYEITTTATSNNYYNISSIDFGECENILKTHYNIDYLIVFKIDIKLNNSYSTVVQYEVYSPDKKQILNLSLCDNSQIELLVPVYIDEETNNLYDSISKEGYDMFNENNSFYKDICTPFTTEDGTDILLNDRQNTYYNENIVLCENTCIYVNYNTTTKRAKCQCKVKKAISKIETISLNKLGSSILFDIKTLSNIEIIKCYKLTFSRIGQIGNYGSIILIFMIAVFIGLIIAFCTNEKYSISNILRKALSEKASPIKKVKIKLTNHNLNFLTNNSSKNINIKTKNPSSSKLNLLEDNHSYKGNKQRNKSNKSISLSIKNYQNINIINKANIHFDYKNPKRFSCNKSLKKPVKKILSMEQSNIKKIKEKLKKLSIFNKKNSKNNNKINHNQEHSHNHNHNQNINHNKYIKKINYNDEELNTLPYKEALLVDKRTYFEFYLSLLKKKHIILFVFMPVNDYNLITIKLGLFIFSFCLYLTVNALFFTDKTMHKIYADKGIFNILFQLPQILYSTLISAVINMIIKLLALSEKDVIKLKQKKIKNKTFKKTYKLFKQLKIKFNLFFSISTLLLIFFWYYISTFCAVYKNTQIILIQNTLTSFGLTLLYPFGLNLFPGFFRIPSLRTPKKDKECMYKLSNILSLLL